MRLKGYYDFMTIHMKTQLETQLLQGNGGRVSMKDKQHVKKHSTQKLVKEGWGGGAWVQLGKWEMESEATVLTGKILSASLKMLGKSRYEI